MQALVNVGTFHFPSFCTMNDPDGDEDGDDNDGNIINIVHHADFPQFLNKID